MGATGERDLGKRVPLGQLAGSVADLVIVTDESPFGEDPAAIRDAVATGVRRGARAELVLGPVQVDARGSHRFDDRAELRAALLRQHG